MAAASASVALLLIAFWMWETRTGGIMSIQLLIRTLAIVAARRGWIAAMFVLFAAGFLPIGIYFLGSPSFLALAGLADLLYLAMAIALVTSRH